MNDKTAIEKAREALVEIANQEVGTWDKPVPFSVLYRRSVDIAREALAALDAEKPGEDAREVARIVHEECFVDISQTTSTPSRSLIWDIDTAAHVVKSFAASYHAEQCKACNKWISVKDRLPEPGIDVFVTGWDYGKENTERHFAVAQLDEGDDFFSANNDGGYVNEMRFITHWQPLPDAPKES